MTMEEVTAKERALAKHDAKVAGRSMGRPGRPKQRR